MSEDWRKRLRNMRTLAGLKREDADASALDGLDSDALRAAADNPDHSEAGRALAARNAPAGRWRLAVPGFINARDLARGQKLFFGWGRVLRKWSGLAFYFILISTFALAYLVVEHGQPLIQQSYEAELACARAGECPSADSRVVATSRDPVSGEIRDHELTPAEWAAELEANPPTTPYEIYGLFIAAASLLPLLVWFVASALRRKPARVLLLRKFNVRAYSEPLERAISNEFRPFGHIASLSDKFIRRDTFGWVSTALLSLGNPLALAWFVIGAPIRFVYRLFDRSGMGPAVVLSARDYRNLARRLRDRIGLNLQVAFTSKEAFLVRTSDAWWRQVIRLFFDSSDVILVDLTKVTDGTAWELDTIRDENLSPRCVFIALWGRLEEAQAALTARGLTNACHAYAPDGHMVDRHRFRAAMLGAMSATHPS